MDKAVAVIEIVENSPHQPGDGVDGILKPNEIRLNGQPLWCPQGEEIEVHGMKFNGPEKDEALVQVTLTLFCRRVFLGHASESPETPERRLADARRRLAEAEKDVEAARAAAQVA